MKYLFMSQEGFDDLKKRLDYLKNVKRKEISQDIATARDKGDLSENAEYHAAKEEQSITETKIMELEDSYARARVIDTSKMDNSKATVLSKVTAMNMKVKKEFTYQLVNHAEANVKEMKISIDSPIGRGLLGSKVGEKIKINVPAGEIEFEILNISF